ncbi:MAG: 3-oxoacyl-[acyl-carrier-protein] synthase III C-terminal domain-containing protein [Acidobacteriota bacterium]
MKILSVGRAFPSHYYDQEQLLEAVRTFWMREHFNPERLERLHKNVLVGGRYLSLPLEEYERLENWGDANNAWIRVSQEVGEAAIRDAIERADLPIDRIGAFFTTTVTGLVTPSLDAHLLNRIDLREDIKRIPIFGLGCVGGAAGLARAADYVRAFPDQVALLLSVELCSLTVQRQDLSIANLIATGLFGDGGAAALVAGDEVPLEGAAATKPRPRIVETRSIFYRDSQSIMGWDISHQGFRIVLSADVPNMVGRHLLQDIDRFLADHGLERSDIGVWVAHPGGPRVLTEMEKHLELPSDALDITWRTLKEAGNLSSASVLLVLGDTLEERAPEPGTWGLLLAMGPGFCSELILLRW